MAIIYYISAQIQEKVKNGLGHMLSLAQVQSRAIRAIIIKWRGHQMKFVTFLPERKKIPLIEVKYRVVD